MGDWERLGESGRLWEKKGSGGEWRAEGDERRREGVGRELGGMG